MGDDADVVVRLLIYFLGAFFGTGLFVSVMGFSASRPLGKSLSALW